MRGREGDRDEMERETVRERLSKKWREIKQADRKAEMWQAREIKWDMESDRWGERREIKERRRWMKRGETNGNDERECDVRERI